MIKEINREDPPEEMKGKGIPVAGIIPDTTERFVNAWIRIEEVSPKARYR